MYKQLGTEEAKGYSDGFTWHTAGMLPKLIGSAVADLVKGERKMPSRNPTGGGFQFPADFLVNEEGKVLAVEYGQYAADRWSVKELFELAKTLNATPRMKLNRLQSGAFMFTTMYCCLFGFS